ncbi:SUKH-3 domain-containing protein [Streptomyces sp. CAU 1734]|uniref:SUKH-3 domain-containing protein n=1 Tax=Streptomyces sp. CAU 1734 TaxID=3140360 RepID=UPI003261D4A7
MERFSPKAEQILRRAGWHNDRTVDVPAWRTHFALNGLPTYAAAGRFLTGFGGIRVKGKGPEITCAREPFEFNPTPAEGEEDRFREWDEELEFPLLPVGHMEDGLFLLGTDETARLHPVTNWVARFRAGDAGVEGLTPGVMPGWPAG